MESMLTALDTPPGRLDEDEHDFVTTVREHGWIETHVSADEEGPDFTYTTGFWLGLKMPEIIIFSIKQDAAQDILGHIYREAQSGVSFPNAVRLSSVFQNVEAVLLPVAKPLYPKYLGWSRWFYGNDDWPCLQLVWPDPNGKFPWEAGYGERFEDSQPNLTGGAWPAV